MGSLQPPHFAIFPFMAQGHTIPLLYLSRLLRRRSTAVTIFTTAANSPPIRAALHDTDVSIVELPFPQNIAGVPPGVENTHKLPSMSSFVPFLESTKLMQKSFEDALRSLHPPLSCVISDAFLGFTLHSAQKLRVPRLAFFGMGAFSSTMYQILGRDKPHANTISDDELFPMTDFPDWKLTRNDFDPPFNLVDPSGPYFEFMSEQIIAMAMSQGVIVNSFYEMEHRYVDYWNDKIGPKSWCVGPLCAAAVAPTEKPFYVDFLDGKLEMGEAVLYVAFGTQAEVSEEQLEEIAKGLERSEVSFLWAFKSIGSEFIHDFEERVKGRGILVREWVEQLEILKHGGVRGFLSHCGWNSVMESVSAGVAMIALPLMAEQHLNTRLVAEEVGVGLRMMPRGGSVRGLVAAGEVERVVREMMAGDGGDAARRKAAEYGGAAAEAMKEGGSSMRTLDLLIDEMTSQTMSLPFDQSCQEKPRFSSTSN